MKKWKKLIETYNELAAGYYVTKKNYIKPALPKYKLTPADVETLKDILQEIVKYQSPSNFEVRFINQSLVRLFEKIGYKVELDNDGVCFCVKEKRKQNGHSQAANGSD